MTRAIFFGCSLTAGAELADPYITGLSVEKLYKLKRESNYTYKQFYNKYVYSIIDGSKELVALEKKLTWAQKLADKLKVPCVNYAINGAGAPEYRYQLIHNLDNITSDDTVFIGITTPARLSLIKEYGNLLIVQGPITNVIGMLEVSSVRELLGYYQYFTDAQFMIETFKALHHMKLLLDRKNVTYYFLDMTWENAYKDEFTKIQSILKNNEEYRSSIELYQSEIQSKVLPGKGLLWYAAEDGFDPFMNNGKNLGYYHPIEEYHEIFAQDVYERLANV